MEKLYEKVGVMKIFWDETNKVLSPEWESFAVSDKEVKECLEKLLLLIIDKKCDRQIINTINTRGGFSDYIQEWLGVDWIPRAVKVGMKYVATILPLSAFAQLSNDYWQEVSTEIGFITINVKTYEEGVKWLQKFPLNH
jgi:hypothetical protein